MGRIVSNFFISLDGVVESPDQWHFPYFTDEMGAVVESGMESAGAFLMGRRLYDEWSTYWTGEGQGQPFSDFINGVSKYVLTHCPVEGEVWQNTTVLGADMGADPVAEVREVKDRTEGDINMSGSATTVRWLLSEGLLDELALLIHPIAVDRGQRLFDGTGTVPLTLTESRALDSGVLLVRYAPA